ncbi:unnamed protein product [marine sediment metagenome]|uniref:Flagellar motor switch protein FliN-like C-terminal domain-containing protein n=1 Tax=marine sediment metagenome TaxID=412755 RepID=X1HUQ3_9ZZZZ
MQGKEAILKKEEEKDVSQEEKINVQPTKFPPLESKPSVSEPDNIELLFDIPLQLTVELGRTTMSIKEVLALTSGSVIELDKLTGESAELLVNGKLIARGEVVVVDENFGLRITEIIKPEVRLRKLQ